MPKLLLRGVILSPLTGSMARWLEEPDAYTISDDLIAAINAETDALDIAVDSPGGDIFAANSIAMAIADWLIAHPQGRATLTVQGMAASAAAAVIVGVRGPRCRIACHRNSQLMFHGVYTTVYEAGAQKFADTAEALEKTNDQIRSALLSRTKTPAALIAQWFAEGREGWVTAAEALEWQIVDEVVDLDAAPTSDSSKTYLNQLKETPAMNLNTLKRIFLKNAATEDPEKKPEDDPEAAKKAGEGEAAPEDPEKKPGEAGEGGEGEGEDPEEKPEEAGEGEDPEKKPDEEGEDDPEEEVEELKKAMATLQETVAALQSALAEATAKNARLTAGLRTTAGQKDARKPATFKDALAAYLAAHPDVRYNDAFCAVAKDQPELYKAFRNPVVSK